MAHHCTVSPKARSLQTIWCIQGALLLAGGVLNCSNHDEHFSTFPSFCTLPPPPYSIGCGHFNYRASICYTKLTLMDYTLLCRIDIEDHCCQVESLINRKIDWDVAIAHAGAVHSSQVINSLYYTLVVP